MKSAKIFKVNKNIDENKAQKSKQFGEHTFKKSLGQNFISDKNLLTSIVSDAGVTAEDFVLEIGAGAGTLTSAISVKAKALLSIEIDESLKEKLDEVKQNHSNLEIVFADFMKLNFNDIIKTFETRFNKEANQKIKVVANIPYYITTPILFRLLENSDKITSISIMVQKEVGERIVAKTKKEEYGAISLMVDYYGTAKIARIINRQNFYPTPNVDSCILRIDINDNQHIEIKNTYQMLVKCAFSVRRKTFANNIKRDIGMSQAEIDNLFEMTGIDIKCRGEDLSMQKFLELSYNYNKIRAIQNNS